MIIRGLELSTGELIYLENVKAPQNLLDSLNAGRWVLTEEGLINPAHVVRVIADVAVSHTDVELID